MKRDAQNRGEIIRPSVGSVAAIFYDLNGRKLSAPIAFNRPIRILFRPESRFSIAQNRKIAETAGTIPTARHSAAGGTGNLAFPDASPIPTRLGHSRLNGKLSRIASIEFYS